jgi:clan AA aspartic protease
VGTIRVKVRLVSAFDEMKVRRGELPADQMRSYETEALVDTGAIRSVIPLQVQQQLGLATRNQVTAEYADGRKETVGLTEPVIFEIMHRNTLEEALVLGTEVLIGQTVLEKLDLWADNTGQRFVPNPAHPDQPVSIVKRTSGG